MLKCWNAVMPKCWIAEMLKWVNAGGARTAWGPCEAE